MSPPGCVTVRQSPSWYFEREQLPDHSGPRVTPVTPHDLDSSSEYLMTQTNELVVLSANTNHSGTYTCLVDGRMITRHRVRVLRMYSYRDNILIQCLAMLCILFR